MRYWTKTVQIVDGYRRVRDRPHGFKYRDQYELQIRFDSELDRDLFIAEHLTDAKRQEPQ